MAERVEVLITGDASGLIRSTDQASDAMANFGKSASGLSRVTDALRSDFGRMTAAFAAAQVGVTALIGVFNSAAGAVKAMNAEVIEAEAIGARLNSVFDDNRTALLRLTAQAEDLATRQVFFDDDAIKNVVGALRAFDMTEEQISSLLPVIINLSTVFEKDLVQTANKVALGLNGMTQNLVRMGIPIKQGSTQAEIFAAILERGEKAAIGAAEAQSGMGAATGRLSKAQGEFNQALGDLLSGPQQKLLNFFSSAIEGATNFAQALNGVNREVGYMASRMNIQTGEVEQGVPISAQRPPQFLLQRARNLGLIPEDPIEKRRRQTAEAERRKEEEKQRRERAAAAPRAARPAVPRSDVYTGEGPGVMPGLNVFRAATEEQISAIARAEDEFAKGLQLSLEEQIAANEETILKKLRAEQEIIDNADEAQRRRNEEAAKAFDEQAAILERAAEDFNSKMLSAADQTAAIVGKALSGQGLQAQDFVSLGSTLASAIFPAFAPLITILGTFTGQLVRAGTGAGRGGYVAPDPGNLAEANKALADARERLQNAERYYSSTMRDPVFALLRGGAARSNLEAAQQDVARLEQIADKQSQAANKQVEAAEAQRQAAKDAQIAAFENSKRMVDDIILAFRPVGEQVAARFGGLAAPTSMLGTIEVQQAEEVLRGLGSEQIQRLGEQAREAIRTGDFSAIQEAFPFLGTADNLLQTLIATLAQIPEAAEAAALGDTPRNPLYVFDVTPAKDEFTRAPRGLFFRPVGSPRAVTGGQSVSGISTSGTNTPAPSSVSPSFRSSRRRG